MEHLKKNTVTLLAALAIVVIVCLAATSLYNRAYAETPPPAEVTASVTWLKSNVPEIKTLQAKLAALQAEKNKRVTVVETFGFSVNWNTLDAERSSLTPE
jgi:uncharacterized membrane protein YgcG